LEETFIFTDQLIEQIEVYIQDNQQLKPLGINQNTKVAFLAQGEYNINFTLQTAQQKYVFRVNTGSQLQVENQIKYEYDSLQYLQTSGVTPKVYFVDDSLSYFQNGVLIMEYLEGVPLNYFKDLDKAAHIFANIHSLDITPPHHFVVETQLFTERIKEGERLLSSVWDSPYFDVDTKLFFDRLLEWLRKNQVKEQYFINDPWHVINNTEVNSHNFIIGKKSAFLIDWEKPVISDPSQDLTQFLAPTTTLWKADYRLSVDEKTQFISSYVEKLNGQNRNIEERIHLYTPYLYLRALAWCAYAYVEYHNPKKQIKNEDTFKKIQQFTELAFMQKLYAPYLR